jgi:SAM-dependent methyltransferase
MSATTAEVADPLAPECTGRPLSARLIGHALATLPSPRRHACEQAYRALPAAWFDDLEREIAHTVAAAGTSLDRCLGDLDAFNALAADVENDAWYDEPKAFTSMHLDALLPGFSRRRHLRTLDQALRHASAAGDVLEVGSGSGRLSELMADARGDWRFTLVDRSAHARRFAAAIHASRGTGARVRCVQGDLARLPAPSASAGLVIAAEVLEHAPDPARSTQELLRVLRPGGWLAVSVPIDLDIAMHPTVFASEAEILRFFGAFALTLCESAVVAPDPSTDAIADVFPGFAGCVNAIFRKHL